jgi:hypothetical protein
MPSSLLRVVLAVALFALMGLPADAQRYFDNGRSAPSRHEAKYDGQFSLVRLFYNRYPGWSYDWPDMEHNLTGILNGITGIKSNTNGTSIFHMDDPLLFSYPIAYLSEPGYWFPTDQEVLNLRAYIQKGGFLIVDDFHYENEWAVFEAAMLRVLPGAKIERLTTAHPIFHTFFEIESLHVPYPGNLGQRGLYGEFYGIHQDNDPEKPLCVVMSYDMDLGDYMEYSGSGFYLVDPSNEAFKFMVNYLIYGHTR